MLHYTEMDVFTLETPLGGYEALLMFESRCLTMAESL